MFAPIKTKDQVLEKWVFKSWKEFNETATALCYGRWFDQAINCCRDGDMGDKGKDGIYERVWWTDEVGSDGLRNATVGEVQDWFNHCSLTPPTEDYEVFAVIVNPEESYVLFKTEPR